MKHFCNIESYATYATIVKLRNIFVLYVSA